MNRTSSKLLLVLLVLVVCVVGFGFYRGWFSLSRSSPDAESNKVDINLTVDPDKVKADAETVKEKTTELTGQATEDANEVGDPAKEEADELTGQAKEDAEELRDQAKDKQ